MVERDGEVPGLLLGGEALDSGGHARGRDGDVPRAEVRSLGMVQQVRRAHDALVVVERLPHPHEHNVRGALATQPLERVHLIDHLPGLEVAAEPQRPGRAEGAVERAADLRRDAHRAAVAARDPDRLDLTGAPAGPLLARASPADAAGSARMTFSVPSPPRACSTTSRRSTTPAEASRARNPSGSSLHSSRARARWWWMRRKTWVAR